MSADHDFQRDPVNFIQLCTRCKLPHARWSGEPCPGDGKPAQPKPINVRLAEFHSAKDSLIETMVAYGVDPAQARIQVNALARATRKLNVEDL